MKPVTRSIIVVAVIAVIALLLWLLTQGGTDAPTDTGALQQPATPAPPPTPAAPPPPQPAEPVVATVLFDYDRAVVRPGEAGKLEPLAARFDAERYLRIDAIGHADRIGSDAYNLALSERRARAVQEKLVTLGVPASSIQISARGEADSASGEACRQMGAERRANRRLIECLQPDRRVEVTLVPRP